MNLLVTFDVFYFKLIILYVFKLLNLSTFFSSKKSETIEQTFYT